MYLIAYFLGYGAAVAWFFTFDREYLILSFLLLAFGAFCFYTCLGISLQIVYNNLAKLEIEGKSNCMIKCNVVMHKRCDLLMAR